MNFQLLDDDGGKQSSGKMRKGGPRKGIWYADSVKEETEEGWVLRWFRRSLISGRYPVPP